MRRKYYCAVAIMCLCWNYCSEARTVIRVRSQAEFAGLAQRIEGAAASEKNNLIIKLAPGTYVVRDGQLFLSGIEKPDLKVQIKGRSALLVPEGVEFRAGDAFEGGFDTNLSWTSGTKDLSIWSDVRFVDGLVEVKDGKTCRLRSKDPLPSTVDTRNTYILVPHWFKSSVYKVDSITPPYITFTANDLAVSIGGDFNVNDDFNYKKSDIRYKLCNAGVEGEKIWIENGRVHLAKGITAVRQGGACKMIEVLNCKLKSLEISGISFCGNGFSNNAAVICFYQADCDISTVKKCSFLCLRSRAIMVSRSPNVRIENCIFSDCWINAIESDNYSYGIKVCNNRFTSMGKQMDNSFCVICRGEDYLVKGNIMIDYGYGGIAVGVWYKSTVARPCCGIIEDNTLTYTKEYMANVAANCIMDSGAIYVCTKNDGAVIRNNHIEGYSGMGDNRGIFMDDGAYNVSVYGNTIKDIRNSYSIDSRRVRSVETTPEANISRSNVNNRVYGNTVDAPIRFEPHEDDDNGCYFGENIVMQL